MTLQLPVLIANLTSFSAKQIFLRLFFCNFLTKYEQLGVDFIKVGCKAEIIQMALNIYALRPRPTF